MGSRREEKGGGLNRGAELATVQLKKKIKLFSTSFLLNIIINNLESLNINVIA